jgi:uncharacterized membrane protein HdeD (DUF308 family)
VRGVYAAATLSCFAAALFLTAWAHGAVSAMLVAGGLYLSSKSELSAEDFSALIGVLGLIGIIAGLLFNFGQPVIGWLD